MLQKFKKSPRCWLPLLLLSLFTVMNWLRLGMAEKIAPPDFYKIYFVAEQLFSGNFKIEIIPPLFPLLMYPLGFPLMLMMDRPEAFIWAGRFLSLISGLGVLFLSYWFLQKTAPRAATPATVFLSLSPWFLKPLAFPITDMLYLFLTISVFCLFLTARPPIYTLPGILAGVLTRFEGVLLIPSAIINYFRFTRKSLYMIFAAIPLTAGVFYFFTMFAPRFYAHFRDIILPQKSYLQLFLHPLEFLNLLYGNILYFVPYSFPDAVKWSLWTLTLFCFVLGLASLFKRSRNLGIALLFYELVFLVSKGYVNAADPEREFRRIFSGVWLFYIVVAIGAAYAMELLLRHPRARRFLALIPASVFIGVSIVYPLPSLVYAGLGLLAAVPVLLWTHEHLPSPKYSIPWMLMLTAFTIQIFQTSYERSEFYVTSFANKAAYAAAQMLKQMPPGKTTRVYSYTNNQMIDYYLIGTPQRQSTEIMQFHAPIRYDDKYRESFIEIFTMQLKENHIDLVIFDHYVVQKPEFVLVNDMQKMLNDQKDNRRMFRVRKELLYKGKSVGSVLKPFHAQTNH